MHSFLLGLPLAAAAVSPLLAQAETLQSRTWPIAVDSGVVANTSTSPATAGIPQVVWSTVVTAPQSAWVRLVYGGVMLSGDRDRGGNGAFLRITSMRDGHHQTQHMVHVGQWQDTSAYFNGDSVLVEILAHQGTGPNRLIVREVVAGPPAPAEPDSICGSTDNRVLSNDPRVARLWPVGCTGWIIDDCNHCLLTAGHCTGTSMQVAQFNVPLSTSGGSAVAPPPSDQYAVDNASVQTNGGQGTGNDWGYFGVFANSTTGLSPFQAQGGQSFSLLLPPPITSGAQIRITGNGSTSSPVSPTWNLVQKTHVGPYVTNSGSLVQYQTDTTGGNSGSPVIHEQTGNAIGIHTHGGCNSTGGQNSGTGANHAGLQAALANAQGVCYCPPLTFTYPLGAPAFVQPDGSTTLRVAVAAGVNPPQPSTGTLHYDDGTGFRTLAMTEISPNVYEAQFPAMACGTNLRWYVSARDTVNAQSTDPRQAPTQTNQAVVAQSLSTVRSYDFNSQPPGWSVANTSVTAGAWARGTPAGGGGRRDPATDFDGSGQCWVTGLGVNDDLDGGPTVLTTDVMDLSALSDPRIAYARWMSNDDLDDFLLVEVSGNGGASWTLVERIGDRVGWQVADWRVLAYTTSLQQVRVRWTVADQPNNSVTEAAIDAFKVYEAPCNQPTWTSFGAPCLGSTGVPLLSAGNAPALGATLQVRVDNTGTALTLLMTGFSNTSYSGGPLPAFLVQYGFPVGCLLQVRPDFAEVLVNQGNFATWSLAIPNAPSLAGLELFHQGIVFGATPAVTQGGRALIY